MARSVVTLYETLGVEVDASLEQIRSSFRQLALKYHPDRYEGAKRQDAEKRFQSITEAFNILSRQDSREKYDRELAQGLSGGGGGMDPKEIARRLAAKGAQAFKNQNLAEAVDLLRSALDHDDTLARAHYFMGATLQRLPGRAKDALRHAERAAQLEPENATIKADAAALCLEVGLQSRAERYASDALGIDPTNAMAAEVLYTLRNPSDEDDGGGGGLFSRLRKKS
jgi:curved DNA-binding protein CbpA